jgi:APA family basic amino acid/polyamine antiporter
MVKKSIASIQAESHKGELKRTLSATNLISLGIGCIIGTGIFVLTGTAAAQNAGPAITISFMLAGLCCAFAAMCYAELSSMLPVSGSAYSYAYASLGELFAWVMGWLLLLEYGVAAATVAVGWSGYMVSFLHGFNINIPAQWTAATGQMVTLADGSSVKAIFNLPAFLAISAVTYLLVLGVKESATVNNVIVFIKLAVVVLFIAIGLFYINPDNWHPFIPENTGDPKHFGWSGVLHGASIVFFAYIGFEAVSTAAQEAKNPQRDIPIGILGSLTICTVLYILVSLVLTGIVSYKLLDTPSPIATAVDAIGLPWLSFIIKIGAIAGLSSVMLVLMYGQTRIFYTMSKDGLLPPIFSKVHPKFQTPWVNTMLVGSISGLVAGMTNINALGNLVNLGTLLAFTIICFTVLYLRKKEPDLERPFSTPYPKVTPVLGMLFCGVLISSLWETFVHLIPYFVLGAVVYFGYGQFHSKLRNGQN